MHGPIDNQLLQIRPNGDSLGVHQDWFTKNDCEKLNPSKDIALLAV
jgi:hypothetical protein